MTYDKNSKKAIKLHEKLRGKIVVTGKIRNLKSGEIKLIYTPGVAAVCEEIYRHPEKKYDLTSKGNNVAIVTDGTRILGLGNIGPYASLPVMEGKAVLYQEFGQVSAFPICLNTTKKDEIVATIKAIEPAFGAINLEDIESPKVLEISDELDRLLSIPVFHDDRHGTSVVVLSALINSLKLVKKQLATIRIVVAGAGSAGYGICKLLVAAGCKNILVTDSNGIIYKGRPGDMNKYKNELASITNPKKEKGLLRDAMQGADVFIGVSGKNNLVTPAMVKEMNDKSIIFALTNPDPEIKPELAKKAGARIVATGSYLYPNKVNNALVFPHIMRAILDKKIKKITMELLLATARAISDTVPDKKLHYENIIPDMYDKRIQKNIAKALSRLKK
ncbi:MAG TPA: NADP-dependent malic enzyme [Candidatus Nitrosotalea sp.]|nr:NADP-dependent malic enzyme [Nitrososphaerota archaeon]HKU33163.1 NADP-dependent malic enzyme [Candidatus Nitrosotalea sp.]